MLHYFISAPSCYSVVASSHRHCCLVCGGSLAACLVSVASANVLTLMFVIIISFMMVIYLF